MRQPLLTEENFNKLPILDRIEYRQKRDELNRHYSIGGGLLLGMLFFWFWLIGSIALTGLAWVVTHSTTLLFYITNLIRIAGWLWIVVFIIILAGEFFTLYKKRKAMDKLQTEYLAKLPNKSINKFDIFKPKIIVKKPGRPKKQNGI